MRSTTMAVPVPGRETTSKAGADRAGALAHAHQAEAGAPARALGLEAGAIILDGDAEAIG